MTTKFLVKVKRAGLDAQRRYFIAKVYSQSVQLKNQEFLKLEVREERGEELRVQIRNSNFKRRSFLQVGMHVIGKCKDRKNSFRWFNG